ncbi:hypothetical protein L202_08239 [Cryptococcus amylolentus CBS 6039]|uniref:PLD phosphodiesterase domain-containing protein n=1 Tax=Cryptococcus amylolentus CBS 6039 TaxID=1295533 RepID=A0A1E3H918_9TREE|nr:hypothetical protein L202_08239 [Cryptococcus amylolentus CBS 6039]ODN72803.1 hypothetical protein L202_08239 [Cryptococcus amylolentus CBS 6039]
MSASESNIPMREVSTATPPVTVPPASATEAVPISPQAPSAYPQPNSQSDSQPSSTPTAHPLLHRPSPGQPPKHNLPPPKLISTHLLAHPDHSAAKAIGKVFPQHNPLVRLLRRFKVKHSVIDGLTEKEEARWEAQGPELRQRAGWKLEGEEGDGAVVSELFWKMYISLLPTLERDPLSGLVPPDLLGSTTTMPLSIISLIPDIMQHYRDVIVRAEKEVFLATNYWQPSNSVNTITQALLDLSATVIKEKKPIITVKVMYDRGSWEQLWNAHAFVPPSGWTPLDLPAKDAIPGLNMEVINFHKVLLGTFHAKFLIVDRKVALINSNNIQDRPNLELMSHFEGPVVDAFYEIALHSWYNKLTPPLPCMGTPYAPPRDAEGNVQYLFQDHNPYFDDIEILKAARAARLLLRRQTKDNEDSRFAHHDTAGERLFAAVQKVVDQQRQRAAEWKPAEELEARAQTAMKELREFKDRWGLGMQGRMGSSSRVGSRGPSRRPSRERHRDEEKQRTLLAPSEGTSSPTITAELAPRSKTYPQPGDTLADDAWASRMLADEPQRRDTFDSEGISRHSLEHEHGEGRAKHHVAFAHEDGPMYGVRGLTESPNASTLNITEENAPGKGAVANESGTIPGEDVTLQGRGRGRTLERTADQPTDAEILAAVSAGHGLKPAPTNSREETLPLSAQMPDEMAAGYETAKKSVALDIPGGKKSTDETQPEGTGSRRMFQLSQKFNAGALSEAWATVEDSDDLDNYRPHVVHAPHEPFPIAMCCRKPHGFPGHHDIRNPQNAAWLAGFRYAKKKVFIQTPTLNARPIVRAVKQACRRGVDVYLLVDLGFNDKGESIPFQGGTNEEVVDKLYKKLKAEKKEQYLKVYWYTGKDQVRPLNAVVKQRNCHIKFAAFDDEVLIIGNGNQDSQSWFHSQEVNVMLDSRQIVAEMMDTLVSNQNTMKYGAVESDGVWRDKEGHTLEHYGATAKGQFRGLSGFIAFAKTI